ncbi:MAG: hypothetical protein K0Q55_1056 [Verrucomicrobia bacterium]|jgi:hypothetical protein|nr:hypothetical protein [Verrucomicrobiota bacterium]
MNMNTLRHLSLALLLCLSVTSASSVFAAPAPVPDERDRQVLESVLLHLLADSKFNLTKVSTNGTTIILHTRTPEKTGFLMSGQIRGDIGNHTLPGDVEKNLRQRNTPPGAKPDTYEAVPAFYTNLTFAAGITVADLTGQMGSLFFGAFEKAHPHARGYVKAYLPGYSKDGTLAVVRMNVGPSAHGGMVTALLEKRGDKWVVQWHHLARYA